VRHDHVPDIVLFQSAPGDEAGRNQNPAPLPCPGSRFQSAPGDEAGRNMRYRRYTIFIDSFNPLPAMKPGGTGTGSRDGQAILFQSAPGDEAGRNQPRTIMVPWRGQFQSAPGDEAGRNTPCLRGQSNSLKVSIRSRR